MRSRSRFPLLCAAAAAVFGVACSSPAPPKKERPPPAVVVVSAAVRDVPVEVRAPVDLRPVAQADVGAKTLGYLDAVLVDRGDVVKRGQLLALVRPSDLPDQLAVARGSLAQSDAALALARTNQDRVKKLAPTGVVSEQELSNASAQLQGAEAQALAAKAQVAALATRLGETRIDSPLDGFVSARRLDPGALVGPQAPGGGIILTVVRIDTLRAFVPVTERDIRAVKVGQEARVEFQDQDGHTARGKVVRIAPTLDASTRTFDAEVHLANTELVLRPGMFGRVAIVVDIHAHAVVVPVTALQLTAGKTYVFVVEGDKVVRREVEIGVDGGDWVEVKRGVGPKDEVVRAGLEGLSDGARIRATRNTDPFTGKLGGT